MKNSLAKAYGRGKTGKIVFGCVFAFLILYAISLLYPLIWMAINSFKPKLQYNMDSAAGKAFALPKEWKFSNYVTAFEKLNYKETNLLGMFVNSIWMTVLPQVITLACTACASYPMARFKFRGREFLYGLAIFSMVIPILGTGGASFSFWYGLGVYDTPFYLILNSLGGFGGMGWMMMIAYFKGIDASYAEAVYLDGGGEWTVFSKVMLPMTKPLLITLFIMGFIGEWNAYEGHLLYMPSYPTLAVGMYGLSTVLTRSGDTPAYFAALLVSAIPSVVMFVAFSDTIMGNFSVGGLKG